VKAPRALAVAITACAPLAALAAVIVPAWYIQPFRPQSPEGLDRALALHDAAPAATAIAALLAVLLAASLWRGARGRLRRAALLVAPALATFAAALAHVNHFELMFGPLDEPAFVDAALADFVADDDVVLAVEIGGDAVAYPVRQMAYHHVVHDVVGGEPVVATY
jgi:hypothetical protein